MYKDKGVSRKKYSDHTKTTLFTTSRVKGGDFEFTWSTQPDELEKRYGMKANHNRYYKNADGIYIKYAHSDTPEQYDLHFYAISAAHGVSDTLVFYIPKFLVDNNILPPHGSDSAEIINIDNDSVTLRLVILDRIEFVPTIDLASSLITRYVLRRINTHNAEHEQIVDIEILDYAK